jgi:large subunit ribosomal protein L18
MKTIKKKRKRESKTNYLKRIKLLESERPRLVFRKTNKYVLGQYITSEEAKDSVIINTNSKELLKHGWPKEFAGSLKSISASYLTGFLIGKKIQKQKLEKPILDIGLIRPIRKSKPFSFLKGVIDSGIDLKTDKKVFPEEERIKGKNLKKDFSKEFEKIKSKIEKI